LGLVRDVEKGDIFQTTDEFTAFNKLYIKSGIFGSEEGTISILGGSTFGGGTTVNYGACFKPPKHLINEWAENFGLVDLKERIDKSVESIWSELGASTDNIEHNFSNKMLLKGCSNLNLDGKVIFQNNRGRSHNCGYCSMGCPEGIKQGSVQTYLKKAAASGRVDFLINFEAEEILRSKRTGKACGIVGKLGGKNRKIKIVSKTIVVSCGAIETPALLLRSKYKNPNIGKHLRLHPVVGVVGRYEHLSNPFQGPIMTAVLSNNEPYGYKLEVPNVHPLLSSMLLSILPPSPDSSLSTILVDNVSYFSSIYCTSERP
jgi:choline dehydrogenase-like flavoprotein